MGVSDDLHPTSLHLVAVTWGSGLCGSLIKGTF